MNGGQRAKWEVAEGLCSVPGGGLSLCFLSSSGWILPRRGAGGVWGGRAPPCPAVGAPPPAPLPRPRARSRPPLQLPVAALQPSKEPLPTPSSSSPRHSSMASTCVPACVCTRASACCPPPPRAAPELSAAKSVRGTRPAQRGLAGTAGLAARSGLGTGRAPEGLAGEEGNETSTNIRLEGCPHGLWFLMPLC